MLWKYISRISGKNEEFEFEVATKGVSFYKWLNKTTSFSGSQQKVTVRSVLVRVEEG